ncbi:hypothetical protein Tco_0645714 [Tanacetum coccineum]
MLRIKGIVSGFECKEIRMVNSFYASRRNSRIQLDKINTIPTHDLELKIHILDVNQKRSYEVLEAEKTLVRIADARNYNTCMAARVYIVYSGARGERDLGDVTGERNFRLCLYRLREGKAQTSLLSSFMTSKCLAWMLLLDLCEVYLPVPVMAISVISISSDSSEDSVGTPAGRVILFGTIPTTIPDTTPVITPPATQTDTPVIPTETPIIAPTIPPSPDYTPASPDYSPASDSESDPSEDPSSDHIPPLPAISPFLSSDDDTTDSDTPDTPPSPTHGTPFTEITASTQRSPIIPRRRVMILSPGQPIPHGRPYRYHLNGPVHMMT